jgi:AcrR family transcriptional regulator
MAVITQENELATTVEPDDSAKRRQIIEGARQVFLAQGFDGASMGRIAREAGVSKGTLYVYFTSKEDLFQVVAYDECLAQAEQVFTLDPADRDVATVLTRLGTAFVKFLCRPERMAPFRTIMSISADHVRFRHDARRGPDPSCRRHRRAHVPRGLSKGVAASPSGVRLRRERAARPTIASGLPVSGRLKRP